MCSTRRTLDLVGRWGYTRVYGRSMRREYSVKVYDKIQDEDTRQGGYTAKIYDEGTRPWYMKVHSRINAVEHFERMSCFSQIWVGISVWVYQLPGGHIPRSLLYSSDSFLLPKLLFSSVSYQNHFADRRHRDSRSPSTAEWSSSELIEKQIGRKKTNLKTNWLSENCLKMWFFRWKFIFSNGLHVVRIWNAFKTFRMFVVECLNFVARINRLPVRRSANAGELCLSCCFCCSWSQSSSTSTSQSNWKPKNMVTCRSSLVSFIL